MRRVLFLAVVLWSVNFGVFAAERTVEDARRFPFEPGKRVVVDVADVDIELRAADVAEIEVFTDLRIAGVKAAKADHWVAGRTPRYDDSGSQLTVSARPGKSGFLALGHLTARARLLLVVPIGAVPDITSTSGSISVRGDFPAADPLRLRTATGSMEFVGAATALDVRSASGNARIEVLRPLESLFARTSSGNLQLSGGVRNAQVDTASGNVSMADLSGPAVVSTSTGRITLRWGRLDPTDSVTVRSTSGKISLSIPEAADPRGHLITTGGTIQCDLGGPVDAAEGTVTLEGTGPTIEAETASGAIILTRASFRDASESP